MKSAALSKFAKIALALSTLFLCLSVFNIERLIKPEPLIIIYSEPEEAPPFYPIATKPGVSQVPQAKRVENPSKEKPREFVRRQKIIIVNLHHDENQLQQFIALENNEFVMSGLVSGAITDEDLSPRENSDDPHNHLGIFRVTKRVEHHVSNLYGTPMDFAQFYHGGHAIHACLPEEIYELGHPASHGCVRVAPTDAQSLFDWADDEPVTVIVKREKNSYASDIF